MGEWIEIDASRPQDNDLVVFYVPIARYVWGCGRDYDQIKAEYPTASHWKLVTRDPAAH